MKTTLIFLISIFALTAFAQDTTYYDAQGNKVAAMESWQEYKIIERNPADTNELVERMYFNSGQIKFERAYNSYSEQKLHGKRKKWYENGQIQEDIDFENGKLNGQVLTYWDNGQLKRKDIYENDELVEGKVWNADGTEAAYYDFQIMSAFPGGMDGLIQYLSKNVQYPRKSRRKGIQGRVLVAFIIEKDGSLSNVEVLEGVNDEIDAEAVRVIKRMPKWKPAMEDGEEVRVLFRMPIAFRLY